MKKTIKRVTAVLLAAILLCGCAVSAFAATPVKDFDRRAYVVSSEDKAAYVDFFNETVNAVKTDLPYARMTYTAGIPTNGLTKTADGETEPLDKQAADYIGAIFDGIFSEKNSAFRSLIKTVVGADSVKNDSFVLHRGAKRNNSVPLYGEDYVSALKNAADFDILVNQKSGSEYPTEMAVTFGDVALEDVGQSSLPLVFSLPDGGMDVSLIGTGKDPGSFLSDVKLTGFRFSDGRIVTRYDDDGRLTYYGSVITYHFTFNYFDAVKIMAAVLGVDIYSATIETINTILHNLGREDISAESILLSRKLNVTYTVKTEITEINFNPRFFGDIDDDGKVTSVDARAALRHAVALERITATEDLLYGDVDFDGEIKASDARLILRMAVGLDPVSATVPEGQQVRIIVIEQDHETPEPEEGETEEQEPGEKFDGLLDIDPAITPSGLVQFIFDTIKNFENAEGVAEGDIQSIVDIIRGIVSDSREKNG